MTSLCSILITIATLLLPSILASPTQTARLNPDRYVVTFKEGVDIQAHTRWVEGVHRRSLTRRDTAGVEKVYRALPIYVGEFDEDTVERIRGSLDVLAVETDQEIYADGEASPRDLAVQTNSTYGLAAISHRTRENNTYLYHSSAGEGTFGYVLDSGIFINHVEFEGRASLGYTAYPDDQDPAFGAHRDDTGHGTHVAGTIGSRAYGVAKKANLVSVKVYGPFWGTFVTMIEGYDWTVNDIVEKNRTDKAVINISLRTNPVQAWDTAIKTAFNLGITTVVSAGNRNSDPNNQGPAYVPECITVGGINSTYQKYSLSNFGPRVDVFAPGQRVLSTTPSNNATDRSRFMDGTSMAAPHVAGLVLYLQALEGLETPQAVTDRILELATRDVIENPGAGSSNLLAYNGIEV